MKRLRFKINRRAMLSRCMSAAALGAIAFDLRPLFAASKSRWFKIGACEHCLGKQSSSCFEVAKQIGLDGVQLEMGVQPDDFPLRKPEVRKAYLEAARRTGLEIPSLGLGFMNPAPLQSDPRARRWLAESIRICQSLGAKITMVASFGHGNLDMSNTREIDYFVEALKSVAPEAERAGITIGLENYLSAEDNTRIIDRVGSPALKVYYDVGNSTDKNRDILKEIRALGKRGLICEFHAKDGPHLLGQGRIDFRDVRKAIDDIGYRGWIQLEAARPNGVIPDYRLQCRYLKNIFPPKV